MPLHADDLERKSAIFKDTSRSASCGTSFDGRRIRPTARYSKAFKLGGFPQAPRGATTNLRSSPKRRTNYDLGLKGDFAGAVLSMDLSLRCRNPNQHVIHLHRNGKFCRLPRWRTPARVALED